MPLDWKDRTEAVKDEIECAYRQISNHESSNWGLYNGRELYRIAGVDDYLMIEKIVLEQLRRGQSRIILMDIGAGDFQWGRGVAAFINGHPLFRDTVQVSIFSLRGERNDGDSKIEDGVCTIYEYGNFKVENLVEELETREHNLHDQVNLIVSDACFRHLVDPTGTMLQAYTLLRPSTGMMCIEGFYLETSVYSCRGGNQNNLLSLFRSLDVPFFRENARPDSRFGFFVMQKSDVSPSIPLTYAGVISSEDWTTGSMYVTRFTADAQWRKKANVSEITLNGCKYSTITEAGRSLLTQVVVDHADVIVAKRDKVLELFGEKNAKNFDSIHRLLKDLIELDQQVALDCIEELLLSNKRLAISVLNHIPEEDCSLLRIVLYNIGYRHHIPPLLIKLIEIASRDVLNAQFNGKTLLISAVDLVVIVNRTAALKRLLLCPEVDVTIVSTTLGKTALEIVSEEREKRFKEVHLVAKDIAKRKADGDCPEGTMDSLVQKQEKALKELDSIREVEILLETATKKQLKAKRQGGLFPAESASLTHGRRRRCSVTFFPNPVSVDDSQNLGPRVRSVRPAATFAHSR